MILFHVSIRKMKLFSNLEHKSAYYSINKKRIGSVLKNLAIVLLSTVECIYAHMLICQSESSMHNRKV